MNLTKIVRCHLFPTLGISDLKMIKSVEGNVGESVTVNIELPTPAYPNPERIDEAVKNKIKEQFGEETKVSVVRTWVVKGANTGGAIGLRVKNVIAVGSGKGGVGKTNPCYSCRCGVACCMRSSTTSKILFPLV